LKFENKTEKPIKVQLEGYEPVAFRTLKKGATVNAESSVFKEYYRKSGLEKAKLQDEEPEVGSKPEGEENSKLVKTNDGELDEKEEPKEEKHKKKEDK